MGKPGQQTPSSGEVSDPLSLSQHREQESAGACFLPGPKQAIRIIYKQNMSRDDYQETPHKNTKLNLFSIPNIGFY